MTTPQLAVACLAISPVLVTIIVVAANVAGSYLRERKTCRD